MQIVDDPHGVVFDAHNTNGSMYADSLIVHFLKLSEKVVSKHLSQFPTSRGT